MYDYDYDFPRWELIDKFKRAFSACHKIPSAQPLLRAVVQALALCEEEDSLKEFVPTTC